ncbi:MAG TPA: helix-turn-helix domain-containing protein [Acidimicrobiales bacterium]|nr:helix-turn-helix domain-containing protein [Acidimicrobiales bacterium]
MANTVLVVTVTEAAEMLGISRSLAYELARTGQLPSLRLGRRLVVPRAALVSLLERPSSSASVTEESGA